MARKPKPTHIKEVTGTARPDRTNPEEPTSEDSLPRAPTWLSHEATEYFTRLASRLEAMGYASSSHTEMLALAADALADVEAADAEIRQQGASYPTTNTMGDVMYRAHPAVARKSDAVRRAQSLLAEFGLSPSSATKVGGGGSGENKNPFSQFG